MIVYKTILRIRLVGIHFKQFNEGEQMKRVILLLMGIAMFIAMPVMAQEVTTTVGAVSGNLFQSSNFSEITSVDNVMFYKDRYKSEFKFYNTDATFTHSFSEDGVQTGIKGTGLFMNGKEVIGNEQVDKKGIQCCAGAAGVAFNMQGIEYNTTASVGQCCGVNFSLESPQGAGRITFGSIYKEQYKEETEGEGATVIMGDVFHKTSVSINGMYNNFNTITVANPCPVGEEPPETPFYDFLLCDGLFPTP